MLRAGRHPLETAACRALAAGRRGNVGHVMRSFYEDWHGSARGIFIRILLLHDQIPETFDGVRGRLKAALFQGAAPSSFALTLSLPSTPQFLGGFPQSAVTGPERHMVDQATGQNLDVVPAETTAIQPPIFDQHQ